MHMNGDGLAGVLNWLDRLPRAARVGAMLVVPLLLLGALVASFALAPGRERPPTREPDAQPQRSAPRLVPPSRPTAAPGMHEPPLSAATDPALGFLRGYLAYSYGRGRLDSIRDADRNLISALRRNRIRVPPAARKRRPRITSLQVIPQAENTAQATATINDGSGLQYPLVFYLDRRSSGWTVTRMGDD
jgi:hypothetical protein